MVMEIKKKKCPCAKFLLYRPVTLGLCANNSLNDLRYTPFDLNVPERSFRPRNSWRFFESMLLKVNGITATA